MDEFIKKVYSKVLLVVGIVICAVGLLFGALFYSVLSDQEAVYLDRVTDEFTYVKVDIGLLSDCFYTQREDTKVLNYYLALDNYNNICVVVLNDENYNFLKGHSGLHLGNYRS